jgi:hypothetical protein
VRLTVFADEVAFEKHAFDSAKGASTRQGGRLSHTPLTPSLADKSLKIKPKKMRNQQFWLETAKDRLSRWTVYTVCQKSFPKCALSGDGFRVVEVGMEGGD